MLVCSCCPKIFRYKSEKIRHEMSHSPGFECETCFKKFSFVSALRRHEKQHKRGGSVKCEECNRKFRDEELLKRHAKYAHKGTFECPKCNSTFSSEQALRTHAKTHRPVSERRFRCTHPGCTKSFNFSHHLKHHELTHGNRKQHYCAVCGKGFIQYHHLKTHLKCHDPSACFYCDFLGCKKKFSTEYAKKRHMTTHRVKPDSGISSDSNSCDASDLSKDYLEDFILCATCGENVPRPDFPMHSTKCGDILHVSSDIESYTNSRIKVESIYDQTMFKARKSVDKDVPVSDCKSALGSCIMGANSCICAQMSHPTDENYDFTPIDNCNVEKNNDIFTVGSNNSEGIVDRYSEGVFDFFDNKENELERVNSANEFIVQNNKNVKRDLHSPDIVRNMCEGCECSSTCNIKEPSNCNGNRAIMFNNVISNVEYTVEGVVKIKDTFDIDFPVKVERKTETNSYVNKESDKFVPFSTCKDVIGNCIVGGNEGCLCARMMMDEQQAMAQEIDDITPVPTDC